MDVRRIIFASMFVMFACVAVTAAELAGAPPTAGSAGVSHRRLSAIHNDVHAALRSEALTRQQGPNAQEVIRLVDLYHEMAAHPQRDTSVVLMQLGRQVRSRLEKVSDRIERQNSAPDRGAPVRSRREEEGCFAARSERGNARAGPTSSRPGWRRAQQGVQPAAAQPGASRTIDFGPELVELIQQTISPATWDVNGGSSSIIYFAPRQVLVVSARVRSTTKSATRWDSCVRPISSCRIVRNPGAVASPTAVLGPNSRCNTWLRTA